MKELLKKIEELYDIPYDDLIKLQKNLNNKNTKVIDNLPDDLSIPYYGEVFNKQCKGIVYDHGLYTQCKVLTNNKFCKKCEKMKYGSIYDRSKYKLGEFVCNNGKKEINYMEYLAKNNINLDKVKEYFIKNNIHYEIKLDNLKKKNSTRGRPKKNIVKLNNTDTHSDECNTKTSDDLNDEYKLDVEKIYIDEQLFYKTKTGLFLDSDLKIVDIETVR
tara:strand:- start:175 stop:825 length:651 start_codon:yes stop_codon:yes gene_type:complete